MRAITILASLLLIALATASPVAAGPAGDPGVYVGTVVEGERDTHRFSSHGGNPCLGVYIPKLWVVTLTHAPADASLSLSAGGKTDVSMAGSATVSFVANYCTVFTIAVEGLAVDGKAIYAVDVESAFIANIGPGS